MLAAHKMTGISNYVTRHMDRSQPIYVVIRHTKAEPRDFSDISLFSIPFNNSIHDERYNVITAFEHKEHAEEQADTFDFKKPGMMCGVYEVPLVDMSFMAVLMGMPMIVIMNNYCDLESKEEMFDLFYTSRFLEEWDCDVLQSL